LKAAKQEAVGMQLLIQSGIDKEGAKEEKAKDQCKLDRYQLSKAQLDNGKTTLGDIETKIQRQIFFQQQDPVAHVELLTYNA